MDRYEEWKVTAPKVDKMGMLGLISVKDLISPSSDGEILNL